MVDSYTLNWAENKLIVTFEDGTIKEYLPSDKEQYLVDYPDRISPPDGIRPAASKIIGLGCATFPAEVVYVACGVVVPAW